MASAGAYAPADWMGVQLVISDTYGLATAISKVFGCPWQQCSVHFLRDMLGHVPRAQQPLVSDAIRHIFAAALAAEARQRLGQVVGRPTWPCAFSVTISERS